MGPTVSTKTFGVFLNLWCNSHQNNTVQKIASPPPTLGTCVWAVQPSPRQTLLHACRSHSDPALPIMGGSLHRSLFPFAFVAVSGLKQSRWTSSPFQNKPNNLFFHTKQTTSSKAAWLPVPAWTAAHCSNCTSQREWLVIDISCDLCQFFAALKFGGVFLHETTTFSVAQVHHLSRQRSCSTKALVVLWKLEAKFIQCAKLCDPRQILQYTKHVFWNRIANANQKYANSGSTTYNLI